MYLEVQSIPKEPQRMQIYIYKIWLKSNNRPEYLKPSAVGANGTKFESRKKNGPTSDKVRSKPGLCGAILSRDKRR